MVGFTVRNGWFVSEKRLVFRDEACGGAEEVESPEMGPWDGAEEVKLPRYGFGVELGRWSLPR